MCFNILSLICFAGLLYYLTLFIGGDKKVGVWVVVIVLFGANFLYDVVWTVNIIFPTRYLLTVEHIFALFLDHRITWPLQKFFNITALPLSWTFVVLTYYGLLQLSDITYQRDAIILLVGGLMGSALFYPIFLVGLLTPISLLLLYLLIQREMMKFKILIGATVFSLFLTIPYILLLIPEGNTHISMKLEELEIKLVEYILVTLSLWCVVLYNYSILNTMNKWTITVGFISLLSTLLLYLLLHLPEGIEYKFFYLHLTWLSIFTAFGIKHMLNQLNIKARVLTTIALLIILTLPSVEFIYKTRIIREYNLPVEFYEDGWELKVKNERENHLYEWIKNTTPVSAVFMDTVAYFPVVASRSLYIPPNLTYNPGFHVANYSIIDHLIAVLRYDPKEISIRMKVQDLVMKNISVPVDSLPPSTYLISRRGQLNTPNFSEVYRDGEIYVYKHVGQKPTGFYD